MNLTISPLSHDFSVCKVSDFSSVNLGAEFCFLAKTDEENSLVCLTADVPENCIAREDGWSAFRISGVLEFSLIGILSRITTSLASVQIGVFAISTYNTDYILVKKERFAEAIEALRAAGYEIIQ